MTGEEILKITEPGKIFSGDPKTLKAEFNKLSMKWHPDMTKKETDHIFSHIRELYKLGEEMLKKGTWVTPGILMLTDKKTKHKYQIRYSKCHNIDIGEMYYSRTTVTFMILPDYKKLYDNAIKVMEKFKFASDNMKKEAEKYLPNILKKFETETHSILVMKKSPDLILLKDALEYFKGNIGDKHVAWIQSSLHNLSCYLSWSKLTHNDISLDTYFISPEFHSGALLGGWWYSKKKGEKLVAVPKRTFNYIPPGILTSKIANEQVDLELIRLTGRELLGDATGVSLLRNKVAPESIINWMRCASTTNSIDDYKHWGNVLTKAYGKRKFIEMKLDLNKFYERKDG